MSLLSPQCLNWDCGLSTGWQVISTIKAFTWLYAQYCRKTLTALSWLPILSQISWPVKWTTGLQNQISSMMNSKSMSYLSFGSSAACGHPYCLLSLCVSGILFTLLARSRRAKGFLFSSGPCALRGFSCQRRDFKTADVLKSGLKLTKLNKARVCPG